MSLLNYSIIDVKKEKHALELRLHEIDKARRAEMRLHEHMKQKFRIKYGKLEEVRLPSTVSRVNDLQCPGFCYHRDGRRRLSSSEAADVEDDRHDFQEFSSLLFTNSELDLDKILCLHLLSCHRCETLKLPLKTHGGMSFFAKDTSPLELMIDRSKVYRSPDVNSKVKNLQTYVLDLKPNRRTKPYQISDGRLATRIIINDNIRKLLDIVLQVLENINPHKLEDLYRLASQRAHLKALLSKSEISGFLCGLRKFSFLFGCDSFHLSRPFHSAVTLNIDAPTNVLVRLVMDIRRHVLRGPDGSQGLGRKVRVLKLENDLEGELRVLAQGGFQARKCAVLLRDKIRGSYERDMRAYRRSLTQPYIDMHQEAAQQGAMEEQGEGAEDSLETEPRSPPLELEPQQTVPPAKKSHRRESCLACQQKWRSTEPENRVISKRKSVVPKANLEPLNCGFSESTHRLTSIIDGEMERVKRNIVDSKNQRKESFKRESVFRRSLAENRKGKLADKARTIPQLRNKFGLDSNAIVNMNLMKIKHQIAVKENSKRIQRFLEKPK